MKVVEIFHIKGRGRMHVIQPSDPEESLLFKLNDVLISSDGRRWQITGLDYYNRTNPVSVVGVLFRANDQTPLEKGDKLTLRPELK